MEFTSPPPGPAEAVDVALAADATSFGPEQELNVRLRDQGASLVLGVDVPRRRATVGAGAVETAFDLPLGRHAVDDGRRPLVFDAGGRIQIHLDQRRFDDGDADALFDAILDGLRIESPDVHSLRMPLLGLPCLAVRGRVIRGEALEQAYLLCDGSRPGLVTVSRVTAAPDDMGRAMDVASVLLGSFSRAACPV